MKIQYYLLTLIALATGYVSGQRGCPSEACDPRGLNCQPDFKIIGTEARIAWITELGPNVTYDDLRTTGCVGNDKNVICNIGDSHSQGYVSVDGKTGNIKWYDTLMKGPRLPIMDIQGDIIATDGHALEFRLQNGSLGGSPARFYGDISNCSSIHYVQDPNLFFFVSYESGGMYMYDTSGMCVASFFLDVKDPTTNHTVSVWVPLSRLIVNTEMDPPCTYFVAQNNATRQYKLFAVNFNHQPPYLSMKWNIDIDVDSVTVAKESRLLVRGHTIMCALPNSEQHTLVIEDQGSQGTVISTLDIATASFASFDYPVGSQWREQDEPPIIWISTLTEMLHTVVYGYADGQYKYSIDINQMFESPITAPTSEIMVFGYHAENVTLVFGYAVEAFPAGHGEGLPPGGYIIAIQPTADGKGKVLWNVFLGEARVNLGQIIGHQEDMLLAIVYDEQAESFLLTGLQLQ